ncbi:MAG: hypothetical protein ACE5D0_00855 [Fidelibacterota bacterium]
MDNTQPQGSSNRSPLSFSHLPFLTGRQAFPILHFPFPISRFPFSIFHYCFYFFLISSLLFSQTHFTVPENVWRISAKPLIITGKYIGPGGIKGIKNIPFNLANYGKRYFDHAYVMEGYYASNDDLYNLDTLGYNANYTVGEYIRFYNLVYNDSIPDLSTDFFGPDSIVVGGHLNQEMSRTSWGSEFKIEYGLSNRVTFAMTIPYFTYVYEKKTNSWKSNNIQGLDEFVIYHQNTMAAMDSALANHYDINLKIIRDRFYSWDGSNSVLWSLGGEPIENGIKGMQYNPFAQNDTSSTTINEILDYYSPGQRTTSGLGDVELGMNILLFGNPAWSESGMYSIYTGLSILLPSADRLHRYKMSSGIPASQSHFTTLPLGDGVTRFNISLFGELYRTILNRHVNINWKVQAGIHSQTRLNTPIFFGKLDTFNPDSIATILGADYTFKKGNEISANIVGRFELVPDWISVSGGASLYLKGRDEFISHNSDWDSWMRYRKNDYDTRQTAIRQFAEVTLNNMNPLKRIGPIPFEIRGGASIPILSRNTFSNYSAWIQLVVYAQAW